MIGKRLLFAPFLFLLICALGCQRNNGIIVDPTPPFLGNLILDSEPICYSIDISTKEGKKLLRNRTIDETERLVLIYAARAHHCDFILNPKFTYLKKNGKVLRVKVFGYPARNKDKSQGTNK